MEALFSSSISNLSDDRFEFVELREPMVFYRALFCSLVTASGCLESAEGGHDIICCEN